MGKLWEAVGNWGGEGLGGGCESQARRSASKPSGPEEAGRATAVGNSGGSSGAGPPRPSIARSAAKLTGFATPPSALPT